MMENLTDELNPINASVENTSTASSLTLHAVLKVTATLEEDVYVLDVDITDAMGMRDEVFYVSRPDDPFGLNPVIRKWLVENEGGYEILPYTPKPPSKAEVDAERDRRIDAGFYFGGVLYQSGKEARENIAGASQMALAAMTQGAVPGDLHWHGEPTDFKWIAYDDSRVPMDAQTMFAFGTAALAHKRSHIFAANDLKKLEPIPADFAENADGWP